MFQPHTRRRHSKFLLLKIRSIQTFQYPCLWVDDVSFGATNFAYFSKGHDLTACSLNMLFFAFKIQPKVLVVFVVVSRFEPPFDTTSECHLPSFGGLPISRQNKIDALQIKPLSPRPPGFEPFQIGEQLSICREIINGTGLENVSENRNGLE